MKDFIKPVKWGKILLNDSSNKKYIYEPEQNDRIVSPYDGIIMEIDNTKCDGFIKIQHEVNNKNYYSEICGINNNDIFVSVGMKVSQNEDLSKCGGKNIIYEIKDSNNDKVIIYPFFNLKKSEEENKKEENKKEENKKEENKKEENKKEENKKEENEPKTNEPKNNETKKWNFNRKTGPIPDLFTSLLLTPIDFANKALSHSSKKETKEEEKHEKLMEEIKRIKQLLK